MKEIWKPILGYENIYEVSNLGRIKSLKRKDISGRVIQERFLKFQKDKDGYLLVTLCKNGGKKHRVHKLVAQAFIPNPNYFECINHKDENRANNNMKNLEWCTHEYNVNYGNRAYNYIKTRGMKVVCVNTGELFESLNEASRIYGIHASAISLCCRGNRNVAGTHPKTNEKLVWRYASEEEIKEMGRH